MTILLDNNEPVLGGLGDKVVVGATAYEVRGVKLNAYDNHVYELKEL